MSTVLLMKNEQGKLEGFGERGAKLYAKFRRAIEGLEVGELLHFSYRVPRAPKFHRLHFAMLASLYGAQEQFADTEQFRKWSEVGAGFCDFAPGPNGRMVALPKSIAYEAIDDVEFGEVHEAVKAFFRGDHAQAFLWPHLTPEKRADMIETLLEGFEQ